jgi:hypothetical protein
MSITPANLPGPSKRRVRPSLIVSIVLLLIVGVLFGQRRAIQDYIRLYDYHPSGVVNEFSRDDTMTASARHVFYVNHPTVQDRPSFNSSCKSYNEQTIVLGCYHPDQAGIYVFSVNDSRLQGVEQVTAAHEMLHAAYDRLSRSQRNNIDAMLEDYYKHDLHDPRILQTIASYKKTEPSDVVNEMHSVFGTEAPNLPAPLEAYYKRYFVDRAKVVAYADSYQAEFTSREATVSQDDQTLKTYKSQIDANQQSLTSQRASLQTRQSTMTTARDSGDTATYNAQVPQYNSQVAAYNQLVDQTSNLITSYNQLVAARNALAVEVNQLAQAISSQPNALSTQAN